MGFWDAGYQFGAIKITAHNHPAGGKRALMNSILPD